ncbi:YbjN domain-containing protein [Methylococcus sp. EFPC2]|uniref:YbjN domain-containing protein n=1 Tax=Methylococcus sp. EFPC2 TaxID=2812648 RepID=UPI001967AB15|nr:YbjN domain-containing protein [Methylococcus sp. EFPC2]QSA96377.1 YbjN domain-containing protein [Methylococcus sp. EFPC2]
MRRAFGAMILSLAASASFAADTDIISAEAPEAILDIAKGFGSASLEKDSEGDPRIVGRIEGTKYQISFYGCSKGSQCDDIQFGAGWSGAKVSEDKINNWNLTRRYGNAYSDSDGDVNLKMTANIDYGVTKRNLEDTFDWWVKALQGFKKDVLKQ